MSGRGATWLARLAGLVRLALATALLAWLAAAPARAQTNAGAAPSTGLTLSETTERQIRDFQWDEAIATYRAAIKANPGNAEAWRDLGRVLRWKGRLKESRAAYAEALALDPDDSDAALGIAASYRYDHDYTTARRLYDEAAKHWPRDGSVQDDRRDFERASAPGINLFYEDDLSFRTRSVDVTVPVLAREELAAGWEREERPHAYIRTDWKAAYRHVFGINQTLEIDARASDYDYPAPPSDFSAIDRFQQYRVRYSQPITPDQVVTVRYSYRPTRLQASRATFASHKLEAELRSQWSPRFATVIGTGVLRDLDDNATSVHDLRTTALVRAGIEFSLTPRLQLSANYITNPDLDNTITATTLAQASYSWNGTWSTLYRFRYDDYRHDGDQSSHYLAMRYAPGGHVWAEAGLKAVQRHGRSGIYPLVSLVYRF